MAGNSKEAKSISDLSSELNSLLRGEPLPSVGRFAVETETLYGGLVGVEMDSDQPLVLLEGVTISAAYAHCFSYFMAAFKRPEKPNAPHPAPWVALSNGGVAYDIGAEVCLAPETKIGSLSRLNSMRLVASMIRLLSGMPIRMPTIASLSYHEVADNGGDPVILALETLPSWITGTAVVDASFVDGLSLSLPKAAELMSNPVFARAFMTFDAVFWLPTTAARLTALWSSIETAMRPGRSNITKRLACALGNYLGADRSERDRLANEVIRLYGERGSSIHDAYPAGNETVRASYLIARSMFIRIIAEGALPNQNEITEAESEGS